MDILSILQGGGYPSPAAVGAVAGVEDLVLRNLLVTEGYYLLARALRKYLPHDASWLCLGVWASKQAGRTIRHEDLLLEFERKFRGLLLETALPGALRERAARSARKVLDQLGPFRRASAAVSRGNIKVFSEIARQFSRFLEALKAGAGLEDFGGELRPGPAPEGQDLLRAAFGHYGEALAETDGKARAELVLLGNLLVGYHEQQRIQGEIEEAMTGALVDARELASRLRRLGLPAAVVGERVLDAIGTLVRTLVTERLMSISFPDTEILRLGDDLTARFPPCLREIHHPALKALLARLDPTPDSTAGTGARDWAKLDQRMHFIVDLFRAYHQNAKVFAAPFSAEQEAAIAGGRAPTGPL